MSQLVSLTSQPADRGGASRQTGIAIDLLTGGIPLTLLLDLASGVDSREIYALEPGAADWLPALAS